MLNETLKPLAELPDVSFIDNDTIDAMMQRLVSNYERRYQEITGKEVTLGAADPMRIALYAVALDLYQTEQYVDRAGKQDLLKYSYGEFLDGLAANRSVSRKEATAARTTVRFTASETKDYALAIPAGIRVTNGDGIYFTTVEYCGGRSRRRICGRGGGLHRRGDGGEQFPPRPGGHSGRPPALHPERGQRHHIGGRSRQGE